MLPNGMDKQYVICLIFNAIINLVLSVTFIPRMGIYGAVLGTIAAELFGAIVQMIWCKAFINGSEVIKELAPFVAFGVVMYIVIKRLEQSITYDTSGLLIQVLVGGGVYLLLCGVFLVEALSVMIQVGYFKYTKKKYGEGRRIFLMSPLHHHFQKKGLFETKIMMRFFIISLLLAAMTLVTLKIQ
jgi:hypothetical protein